MDAYEKRLSPRGRSRRWISCSAAISLTFTPWSGLEIKRKPSKSIALARDLRSETRVFLPDTTVRIDGAMAFVAGHEDLWEAAAPS